MRRGVVSALSKGAGSPELKVLGEDLLAHENALRDWMQSELGLADE